MMSELEKMKAGLEYCYDDEEIAALKDNAIMQAERYNNIDPMDKQKQYDALKEILGSVGENVWIGKTSVLTMEKTSILAQTLPATII